MSIPIYFQKHKVVAGIDYKYGQLDWHRWVYTVPGHLHGYCKKIIYETCKPFSNHSFIEEEIFDIAVILCSRLPQNEEELRLLEIFYG